MSELNRQNGTNRTKMIRDIETMLGGEIIDVELDTRSYELAVELALDYYRQRSGNSVEESYLFIELNKHTNDYILPQEIIGVRKVFRKSFGVVPAGGGDAGMLDPFDVAFTNMIYMQDPANGGLATYDMYRQNMELAGRLFGLEVVYSFNNSSKRLKLARHVRHDEEILLWVDNYRPDEELLIDTHAKPWLRRYALAEAKIMLGRAYGKFSNLAGPQGGVAMNGNELISEAMAEKDLLEDQLRKYAEGSEGLGFFMG